MLGFSKLNQHAGLLNKMADTLGVDLAEAAQEGRLAPEDLRASVLRCTGCSDPAECMHFLVEHAATGAEAAPEFCRNRQLFSELRGR